MWYKLAMNNITANAYSIESLKWLIEAGADEAIGEVPINRFETSANAQAIPQSRSQTSANANRPAFNTASIIQNTMAKKEPSQEILGTNQAVEKAKALCADANTFKQITNIINSFDGCPSLKNTAANTVIYRGASNPEILCIGHAPNRNDDQNAQPFSGNNEMLLDRMFKAIDVKPETMGFTNGVFWAPPGGRSVSTSEFRICKVFLDKIIEILSPKMIILFGGEVSKSMLSTNSGIGKLHGKTHIIATIGGASIPCMPLHHPDYILETPVSKPIVWNDLKILKQLLTQ